MVSQSKLPRVIPPRSVVRLVRAGPHTPAWKDKLGKRYRIGYYQPRHGLREIILLDEKGRYFDAVDPEYLMKYFRIERLSKESDYFGVNRRRIGPVRRKGVRQDLRRRIKDQRTNVRLPLRWSSKILTQFKWPIATHIQGLRSVLCRMRSSRRKQPPFHYFVWPDKMRVICFDGNLDRLLNFLDKAISRKCCSFRQAVRKRSIADWQFIVIKSVTKPDLLWLATHRIGFVTPVEADIWAEFAIQKLSEERYLAWRWRPTS